MKTQEFEKYNSRSVLVNNNKVLSHKHSEVCSVAELSIVEVLRRNWPTRMVGSGGGPRRL